MGDDCQRQAGGREEGIRKGAHQKAREIATMLKQKGWSPVQIAEMTGIPPTELEG